MRDLSLKGVSIRFILNDDFEIQLYIPHIEYEEYYIFYQKNHVHYTNACPFLPRDSKLFRLYKSNKGKRTCKYFVGVLLYNVRFHSEVQSGFNVHSYKGNKGRRMSKVSMFTAITPYNKPGS